MQEKITFNKITFDKSQFNQVVNTQFTQLVPQTSSVVQNIDVNQFFEAYDNLFYQIPRFGETKSHEFLVKQSGEYIGNEQINEEIQALVNEIDSLRQENLDLQKQLININISGSI